MAQDVTSFVAVALGSSSVEKFGISREYLEDDGFWTRQTIL